MRPLDYRTTFGRNPPKLGSIAGFDPWTSDGRTNDLTTKPLLFESEEYLVNFNSCIAEIILDSRG